MSPRSPEFTERVNVFFSKEQLSAIKEEAKKQGVSVSTFLRMIVVKSLNERRAG